MLVAWWAFFVIASHGLSTISLVESVVPFTVLLVTLLAWRWHILGGFLFALLGALYVCLAWGRMPVKTHIFVAGPLFVAGSLFIFSSWRQKNNQKRGHRK